MIIQRTAYMFVFVLLFILMGGLLVAEEAEASDTKTFKVQKRFLYVQPGQNVFSIIKVLYPDKKNDWPGIIKQIVRKNPHAFENSDATKILIGQRIELPVLESKMAPVVNTTLFKASESVGQVIEARGKRFAISSKNKNRELKLGSEVYVGDRLFTGPSGFIRLSMIDDAKIDLRCNSEMLIEDYQLMRAGNRSIIYLIKGSLRKITGSIGKFADDVYEMKTPISTVGVRGTDYALRVLQTHGCDGSVDVNSKGLFIKVNSGAIDLKNKTGSVSLNKGEAAHIKGAKTKPQSISVDKGVFEGVKNDSEEENFSWWWLLAVLALAVVI